jgi:hypothetical protein
MKKKMRGNEGQEEKATENAEEKKKESEPAKPLTPSALGEELEDIFDISREIELLKEIKDIRDELNILRNLFDQQKRVLESFCPAIETGQKNIGLPVPKERSSLMDAIQRHIDLVASMDEDAKRPYEAVRISLLQGGGYY